MFSSVKWEQSQCPLHRAAGTSSAISWIKPLARCLAHRALSKDGRTWLSITKAQGVKHSAGRGLGRPSVIKSTRFVRKRHTEKVTADTYLTNYVPGKFVGALAVLTRGGLFLGILATCIALGGGGLAGLPACSAVATLSWVGTPRRELISMQPGVTTTTGRGTWGGW